MVVRRVVAGNPSTAAGVLQGLVMGGDLEVSARVAVHPHREQMTAEAQAVVVLAGLPHP